MSQQAVRQAWFRSEAGVSSGSYTENVIAAAVARGFAGGSVSEALAFLANAEAGANTGNLPGDLHAWSQATTPTPANWSSAGDLSAQAAAGTFNFNPDAELDHWNRGANLTSIADSKQGTVSFALTMGTFISSGTRYIVGSVDGGLEPLYVRVNTAGRLQIRAGDSAGNPLFSSLGAVGILPGDGLTHYVCTWDVDAAGANTIAIERNGVPDTLPTLNDRLADYATATDWSLGAAPDGTLPISMALDNVAFWPGVYEPDLTKFWNGGIVDLGPNGTSSGMPAPLYYFNANWQSLAGINAGQQLGTGGNGSMTGTIT